MADRLPLPPGRRRRPETELDRLRRQVREYERGERPFDPEARRERYAQPHHFAVNEGGEESSFEKRVEIIGDFTGSDDHAWVLYRIPGSNYITMEYWDFPESYGQPEGPFVAYRIDVADDVMRDLDWIKWKEVARYVGAEVQELDEAARSDNPMARAQVYEAAGSYHGWGELDLEPLELSPFEMHQRWPSYVERPEFFDFDYEAYGPEEDDPTNGLRVHLSGGEVEITEWTDMESATGEEAPEGEEVLRIDATVDVDQLFDPDAKHVKAQALELPSLEELFEMSEEDQQKAVVDAATAYLAYWGGEESFVEEVGD